MSATRDSGMYGLVAEFSDEHDLLEAARRTQEAGYKKFNVYTPYPVHGLSDVLGHQTDGLRWFIFGALSFGAVAGFSLQYYTAVFGYQLNVAGRPLNSWPAFIPISFEVAILLASLAAVLGMLLWNGLPLPYHPIFNTPDFELSSGNRFYICIRVTDERFNLQQTTQFLQELKPAAVNEVSS